MLLLPALIATTGAVCTFTIGRRVNHHAAAANTMTKITAARIQPVRRAGGGVAERWRSMRSCLSRSAEVFIDDQDGRLREM